MKKLIIAVSTMFFYGITFSQQTTYFDKYGEKTSKSKMDHYLITTNEGGFLSMRSYYKNGAKMFEGKTPKGKYKFKRFEGKSVLYYPDGKIQAVSNSRYDEKDNYLETKYTYKSIPNEEYANTICEYKNEKLIKEITFDESEQGIRQEEFYNDNRERTETKFYNDKGEYIGSKFFLKSNSDYTYEGINVKYYYPQMSISLIEKYKDGKVKESTSFYRNGKIMQHTVSTSNQRKIFDEIIEGNSLRFEVAYVEDIYQTTYDMAGKELGKMHYIQNIEKEFRKARVNGTEFKFFANSFSIESETLYKDKKKISEKIYNKEGEILKETIF